MNKLLDAPEDIIELASNWPLCFEIVPPENSTIVVVGAYQGKVMELMARLQPQAKAILGFEPQEWAYKRAVDRIHTCGLPTYMLVFNYGLATEDIEDADMGEFNTDAASLVNTGEDSREHGVGQFVEAGAILDSTEAERIDLMIINIEGYEFQLLPHLKEIGWLDKIDRLVIQWHLDLSPEFTRARLQQKLLSIADAGFNLIYDRRPTWTFHEKVQL